MPNEIRDQFVRDMQVAGLSAGTRAQYLSSVDRFFKAAWLSPEAVTEQDVQSFLIGLRERDVARETFRGYRYALESLFRNTLGRDWALFTKKKRLFRRKRTLAAVAHEIFVSTASDENDACESKSVRAKQGLSQASESASETGLSLFLRPSPTSAVLTRNAANEGTVPARGLARTVP